MGLTTPSTHACTHSRTLRNLLQTHNMSNSDKFDQDAAIVPDEQVPQQLEGVLNSSDNDEFTTDEGINAPEGENYESVRGNEISKGEFENDGSTVSARRTSSTRTSARRAATPTLQRPTRRPTASLSRLPTPTSARRASPKPSLDVTMT